MPKYDAQIDLPVIHDARDETKSSQKRIDSSHNETLQEKEFEKAFILVLA
jgi:hypothetical protein